MKAYEELQIVRAELKVALQRAKVAEKHVAGMRKRADEYLEIFKSMNEQLTELKQQLEDAKR